MLTLQDKEFLASKGITEEQVAAQLKDLERGFPFLKLAGAAEAGKGIVVCDDAAVSGYLDTWKEYKITYCQDGNGLWDIHIEQVVDITVNVCYHLKCLVLILVTHITLITSNYL